MRAGATCGIVRAPMKLKLLALLLTAAGLLVSGCGQKEPSTTSSGSAGPSDATLEFTANDSMKFNVTRVEVAAGRPVKVIFTNIGSLPKAAMGHNWVLLNKGVDGKAFCDAAVAAAATDYIPAAMAGSVLAHTKLLGPKQTDEITFTAPTEPGEYPFVCSFPAHYVAGMHGVLVVK